MRSVNELDADELRELRSRLFHQMSDDGSMEEVLGKEVEDEDEIPMDLVKSHYAETFFVEEDFWCNTKSE